MDFVTARGRHGRRPSCQLRHDEAPLMADLSRSLGIQTLTNCNFAIGGDGAAESGGDFGCRSVGHGRIRELLTGSTTTEMIRRCRTPVMLFR